MEFRRGWEHGVLATLARMADYPLPDFLRGQPSLFPSFVAELLELAEEDGTARPVA